MNLRSFRAIRPSRLSAPRPHKIADSHHEFKSSRSHLHGASSDRSFGLVFGIFFCLLAIDNVWRGTARWPWYVAAAAAFFLASWFCPGVLAPLNRIWARLGRLLGKIATPVVLGAMFFVVVTPVAALARMMGKDFLRLKRDPAAASYWIRREPPAPSPESLRDQF